MTLAVVGDDHRMVSARKAQPLTRCIHTYFVQNIYDETSTSSEEGREFTAYTRFVPYNGRRLEGKEVFKQPLSHTHTP